GHGVGNASASATNAIFLTVLQDVLSRLTTVVAGYHLGTSLYPEAKTYRLLADILNDAAIISDTLSPHVAHVSFRYPFVTQTEDSWLRVVALCMSGVFRALCGAVAGGSKAALTVHFATAGEKPGDVGDVSAKDGSKETVLALLGMLCGSIVLHYVHSARATYLVLLSLIVCHLSANIVAVRVIAMRVFNRQRASLAWTAFRATFDDQGNEITKPSVPSYLTISRLEHIFAQFTRIPCSSHSSEASARCLLGVPFSTISEAPMRSSSISRIFSSSRPPHSRMDDEQIAGCLELFTSEKYILWFTADPSCPPSLAVVLKEGHGPHDHLKAWAYAHEVARLSRGRTPSGFNTQLAVMRDALAHVSRMFPLFMDAAKMAGWKREEGVLVGGLPVTIAIETADFTFESRKDV
ncbi:vitamin B6 photo-protection and homoeostasis-domain-containing protein, partial [Trametes punicea]